MFLVSVHARKQVRLSIFAYLWFAVLLLGVMQILEGYLRNEVHVRRNLSGPRNRAVVRLDPCLFALVAPLLLVRRVKLLGWLVGLRKPDAPHMYRVVLIAGEVFTIDISDLELGFQLKLDPRSGGREVECHHLDAPGHLHRISLPSFSFIRRHVKHLIEVVLPEWGDLLHVGLMNQVWNSGWFRSDVAIAFTNVAP